MMAVHAQIPVSVAGLALLVLAFPWLVYGAVMIALSLACLPIFSSGQLIARC